MPAPASHPVAALRRARVEIIPLIDVIFFLLATFVLFTLSLNRIRSVPVSLPYPGEKLEAEVLRLQVSGDGAIYWNQERVDLAEIPGRLTLYKNQTENPRVVVRGDEQARFGITVAVLDALRQSRISAVTVETRVSPTGR